MKYFRLSSIVLSFPLFCLSTNAQTYALSDTIPADPDFMTGRLANGLTYYIRDNGKAVRNMQLRLVVNAGSLLENDDQQGIAHFMEHMNFNGLKHFPKNELETYLESLGLKFGADLNATTGFDATNYILWLATDKNKTVDKALTILEDWNYNALLDEEEVVKERGVVLEESRLDKNVQQRLQQKYFPAVLNNSRYASREPIGKDSLISSFNAAAVRYFYSTWYRPDLSAVIVAGDIDPEFILKKIHQHFDDYTNPVNETPRPADIVLSPRKKETYLVLTDKEMPSTLLILFGQIEKTPAMRTWSDYRQGLVEKLYTLMLNERLKTISELPGHPVLGAYASYDKLAKGYRSFNFRIMVSDHSLQAAANALVNSIQSTVRFGFLPEELARAKNNLDKQNETSNMAREKTGTAAFAEACSEHFIYGTPIISLKDKYQFTRQELGTITLEEVNQKGKRIQLQEGRFNLILAPDKSDAAIDEAAFSRLLADAAKNPVSPYTEKAVSGSLLEKEPEKGDIYVQSKSPEFGTTNYTLKNGISVTLKPSYNEHDNIQMDAWRYGGSNNFGLANKMNARYAAMIVQSMGITRFPKPELEKFLAGKTVSVTPYLNNYEEGIEGKCSPADLTTFFQLIYAYFTAPAKDEQLFQSFISKQKGIFQNAKASPQNYFADSAIRFQYQDNPWANTIPGPSDFEQINLDSAYAIYRQVFDNAYGMHFTFTGNFDIATIKPLVETYLGSLPTQQKKNHFTDEGLRPRKGIAEMRLKKGEDKQSRVRLVFTGEYPVSPEETIRLNFLCDVIQIRIIEKLREQMSGIYAASVSAASGKRPYEHYTVNISFPCGADNVDTLTRALLEIIDDIRANGVEKKYLVAVKKNLMQRHAYAVNTSEYWLQTLSSAWINNEDPKWALKYDDIVDGISGSDLRKTAEKYFDMNNYLKEVLLPQ